MKKANLFTVIFIVLSMFGILMIYSASMIWAEHKTGNQFFFLIRQSIFFIIACVVFFVISNIDYKIIKKYTNYIFLVCIILLILVLIPGVGIVRGGARSWIGIGDLSIQPSEFMKIGMILFTAKFISNYPDSMTKLKTLLMYVGVIAFVFFLIMLEPDFGSGFIIIVSTALMLFVGLMSYKYFFMAGLAGMVGMTGLILSAPYRLKRIFSFLDPWQDPQGAGFQIIQSLFAISPSSLFGYGLFNSRQKFFFLPEPQTDFIFAIIAEELGIIGALGVLIAFFLIIYLAIEAALRTDDLFAMFTIFGFASLIFIQIFVNIGVVIGLMPVTGVTLPFLSYGGSSLVISFIMMGIIVSVMKSIKVKDKININTRG